ncbi:hypothetical protein MCB86_09030 [Pseudomonas sp. KSR10]|uniref:hypothetical protein n=1 Tax=Pseudomonas sp. KSR10 TaxID=2916654 RepID=UPI001EF9125A|nr:hypothetical protein [Pseudomonas sp. KSR10]MCG6540217.1 hypothetical protein [Pseudomonas sp. KSR10]
MNRALPIPHDDTPSGHSYAAALWTIWIFGLTGVFLFGLAFEAALNHFFGV